jgi:hypothetical protein
VSENLKRNWRGVALEPEDAARQILGKHSLRSGACPWRSLNSIKDFCFGDGRRNELCCRLFSQPMPQPEEKAWAS